jgi:hypothetical protein
MVKIYKQRDKNINFTMNWMTQHHKIDTNTYNYNLQLDWEFFILIFGLLWKFFDSIKNVKVYNKLSSRYLVKVVSLLLMKIKLKSLYENSECIFVQRVRVLLITKRKKKRQFYEILLMEFVIEIMSFYHLIFCLCSSKSEIDRIVFANHSWFTRVKPTRQTKLWYPRSNTENYIENNNSKNNNL